MGRYLLRIIFIHLIEKSKLNNMADIKFGLKQIGQPSPKIFKVIVNLLIVFFGVFVAPTVTGLPDGTIDPNTKTIILCVLLNLSGFLKAIEKLLGDTSDPNYNAVPPSDKP